jgi:hypothetical protein
MGRAEIQGNGNRTTGNSYNNCEPLGFISYPSHPHPIEILQTPDRIVFFHEVKSPLPDDLDGRAATAEAFGSALRPNLLGVSVGRWERNDLIVGTVGFNDKTCVDTTHHPHSEQMHLTERYHRVDQENLAVTLTFDDPKAYTKTFMWGPKNLHLKTDPSWALGRAETV